MTPPSFTSSNTTKDPENFTNKIRKGIQASWAYFEKTFLGRFSPQKLKEDKVREFLTLKQDYLSVHEYG